MSTQPVRTLTLTDFLLARIAEDEAIALRAPGEQWRYEPSDGQPDGSHGVVWGGGSSVANHGRILAECEAKRRIVEFWPHTSDEPYKAFVLRTLATVYADHPDYREDWKS